MPSVGLGLWKIGKDICSNMVYEAIKIGFGKINNSKLTKQMKGYFAKKST